MRCVRRRYSWKIRDRELSLGVRTMVMGILSVATETTPRGRLDPQAALAQAMELQDQGADLIEINADPLRSRAQRISSDEELRCLVPVLRKLRHNLDVPMSINTYNAETAERALDLGVQIVNDVSGLSFDPRLARVVNQKDAGLILTHIRGAPDTWAKMPLTPDPIKIVARDLKSAIDRALGAGIDRRRIVVDPGLELGKRRKENYKILADLERLSELQQPILVSPSHKSFLTDSVRAPESEWLFGATAAVTVAVCSGAHIIRAHDVKPIAQVAKVADRFLELED